MKFLTYLNELSLKESYSALDFENRNFPLYISSIIHYFNRSTGQTGSVQGLCIVQDSESRPRFEDLVGDPIPNVIKFQQMVEKPILYSLVDTKSIEDNHPEPLKLEFELLNIVKNSIEKYNQRLVKSGDLKVSSFELYRVYQEGLPYYRILFSRPMCRMSEFGKVYFSDWCTKVKIVVPQFTFFYILESTSEDYPDGTLFVEGESN